MFPTKARNAENSWKVLMIILVDIECIDYSWIFDCWVSSFLNNRARELRFLYAEAKRIRRQQKRNIYYLESLRISEQISDTLTVFKFQFL